MYDFNWNIIKNYNLNVKYYFYFYIYSTWNNCFNLIYLEGIDIHDKIIDFVRIVKEKQIYAIL